MLAGVADERLVLALPTAHAVESAALDKGGHETFHDGAPVAVLSRKPLVVDLLERVETFVHQTLQIRGLRIAWMVRGSSAK